MPLSCPSGISLRFQRLSRARGQVVYVLLTRSPLRSDSKLSSLRPTCMY